MPSPNRVLNIGHLRRGPARCNRRAFLRGVAALGFSSLALRGAPRTWAATDPPTALGPPASRWLAAAARAFDGLLARIDLEAGGRPYFLLDLEAEVPALVHGYWDAVDMAGRSVDALLRLRPLLATEQGKEAELLLRQYLLGRQGSDGLFYNAPDRDPAEEVVDTFCQGRALLGLTTWLAHTGDAVVEASIEACVRGLAAIAVRDGEYAYLPGQRWREGWLDQSLLAAGALDGRDNFGYSAQCALPLLEYHALTGSPAALDLAGRLLRHFVERSGQVDGDGHFAGETHASGYLPLACAAVRYAAATGDEGYLRWAERLYRWVLANSSQFGWVPGPLGLGETYFRAWYGAPPRRTCETCSLADTIELALLLARAGYTDCWDDVDRFARNQLLENQFGALARGRDLPLPDDPTVAAALAGAWESFALPYRLLARPDDRRLVEGCCSASGARALSRVWEHTLDYAADTLTIHLGLSRSSPWADVYSHEPQRGQLDIVLHVPLALRLRPPRWAPPDGLTLLLDEVPLPLEWDGDYLTVAQAPAGACLSLRYPLLDRQEGFAVNAETTLAFWRGGTVLDVLPDSGPVPIYRRDRLA